MITSDDEDVFFYKIFQDVPKLPKELKKSLIDFINATSPNRIIEPYPNASIHIYKNEKHHACIINQWSLDLHPEMRDLVDWLNSNVFDNTVTGWEVTLTGKRNKSIMPVHTDRTRRYALMYVLEPGGAENCTRFFQEKNQTLIRENATSGLPNIDSLIEIDGISIPEEKWTVFNAKILHAVTGIDEGRLTLQGFLHKKEDFLKDNDYVSLPAHNQNP